MQNTPLYLRQNVQMEPLFNQWYAWTHLIAPAPAAMNIANSHVKIMKSYIAAPQVHANAVKNPAMLGGPFIDYQGQRVDEIKKLMEKTSKEQAHMIKFAESVKALDEVIRNEARGYSMEPLYQKIPDDLRGFVEIVYDLNNNPSIKFIEGLLYRSKYYNPSSQAILLSLIHQDDRPFALSTPRLPSETSLQLNVPFNHGAIDELFKMRETPQPFGYIKELLHLDEDQEKIFCAFLTDQPPAKRMKYDGDGIVIRYYGHACLSIETKDVCIFTDPVLSYAFENGIERYTYQDLPETIDYVLITHGHQDHIMFETLVQLRHKIKTVIVPKNQTGALHDPSLKLALQNIGFKRVIEIEEMETIEIEGGKVTGLPFLGEHADLNIGSKIAHLLHLNNKKFLFAADSNNIEPKLYEHIFSSLGDIDALFLGMECDGAPMSWLYGPLSTKPLDRKMDQSRRLSGSNYEKGISIVDQFDCQQVFVYAMGQEPWLNYVMSIKYTEDSRPIVESNKLIEECRRRGIMAERLYGKKRLTY